MWRISTAVGLTAAAVLTAAPANADVDSYLRYLQDNGIYTALNSPAMNIHGGMYACDMLRAGQTPEQIAAGVFSMADAPGMIRAAQSELCPETLP